MYENSQILPDFWRFFEFNVNVQKIEATDKKSEIYKRCALSRATKQKFWDFIFSNNEVTPDYVKKRKTPTIGERSVGSKIRLAHVHPREKCI